MNGISALLVRLAAHSLPLLKRARYREEWLADLAGAADAGVSRAAVVVGALSTAATIDRLDPAASGLALGRVFVLRLRAATGLGLGAAVLAIGADAYGGFATLGPIGIVLSVISTLLAVVAVAATVAAVRAAVAVGRVVVALLVVLGALALLAVVLSRAGLMIAILAGIPGVAGLAVLAAMLTGGRVATRRGRRAAGIAIPVAALVVAAFGLAHVFLWNPLAKLPGMTLAEIYTGLANAGEGVVGGPTAWVVAVMSIVAVVSIAYVVFVLAPVSRWSRLRTRRRLLALGLLIVGGTVGLVAVPGFSMGMGIADAFATSGGDAAAGGGVLAAVGMLAVAGTIVVSFVRFEPGPPQGRPVGVGLVSPLPDSDRAGRA